MNKNTCIVEVRGRNLHFWPYTYWIVADPGTVDIDSWPAVLAKKFNKAGLYTIQRVAKGTRGAVSVGIRGLSIDEWDETVPAEWLYLPMFQAYYVCRRFLNFIGVKIPDERRKRHFHLKVTKI